MLSSLYRICYKGFVEATALVFAGKRSLTVLGWVSTPSTESLTSLVILTAGFLSFFSDLDLSLYFCLAVNLEVLIT